MSEFASLYGVQTFLVSQVFRERISFSHAGLSPLEMADAFENDELTNKKLKIQLHVFTNALIRYLPFGGDKRKP